MHASTGRQRDAAEGCATLAAAPVGAPFRNDRAMSLTPAQIARTAEEFRANLAASGLTRDQLRERTGLPARRFDAALDMRGGDPVDMWQVRDALETAVADAGGTLTPFSAMPEHMRAAASAWFGVTDRR